MSKKRSVVFGYDKIDYGTTMEDAFRPEQYDGSVAELKADRRRARKLKAALKKTHVHMAMDDDPVDYKTAAFQVDPRDTNACSGKLLNQDLRTSHVLLGYEQVDYNSSMRTAFNHDDGKAFMKEARRLGTTDFERVDGRVTHYVLGDDELNYSTVATDSYKAEPPEVYQQNSKNAYGIGKKSSLDKGAESQTDNIKLGYVTNDYRTTNFLDDPHRNGVAYATMVKKEGQNASYVSFGDDDVDYESVSKRAYVKHTA